MDNEMFAIDNELSTELITRQNELNKAIYHHSQLLNDKNGNNIIKAKILEKKIIHICEQQKAKFNGLRRERLKASNLDTIIHKQQIKTNYQSLPKQQYVLSNQTLLKPKNAYLNPPQSDKQQQQLKSFNSQKLIIPNERILVVSTPGGGARLVTTTTNTTRSTLSKSNNGFSSNSLLNNHNKTQFNNLSIINKSTNLSTNLQNSKSLNNDKSINSNQLSSTESTNTINKRKSAIQPLIDCQEQLIINKPKIVEQQQSNVEQNVEQENNKQDNNKVKEEFFFALGLLTKTALHEIQNKKSERKRRTTANPQFSSAAIAAKRNLALELAAKKAKKRELAASNQDKYLNQQTTKRNFLNSNNNRNKVTKQDNKKQVSKVPNKQLNSQPQIKQINQDLSINCFTCGDLCDSDLDEIGFCAHCKLLFHVYCSTSLEKLQETNGYVPCPKCDRKKLLELNNDLNETIQTSDLIQKQKLESISSASSSSIISKSTRRRKLSAQSKNGAFNNNNRINNVTQFQKGNNKVLNELSAGKLKSTIDLNKKDSDKMKLLIRHFEIIKLKRKYLEKISSVKGQLVISKENKKDLLMKKEQTMKAIQTIVNLYGKIREQKDNNDQKENKEISNSNKIELELVDKLNNNLKQEEDKIEDDNLVNNNLVIDSNVNESNNNESIEKNDEIDLSKSNNDSNEINKTNETVNILNSLSTSDQQLSIDQQNPIKKEEIELTEKEKDLMQDYTEDEKEAIQNLINYSNSTIQQHQDSQLISDNQLSNQEYQLQIESSNQINSQLIDNINTESNIELNTELDTNTELDKIDNETNQTKNKLVEDNNDPSIDDDQPPKKKICTPERKQDLIENDVIMDEINMAIASISN